MTKVLVVSGRDRFHALADACAYDFEDAILDATGGDILTVSGDRSTLALGYDLIVTVAVSFNRLFAIERGIRKVGPLPDAVRRVAYVFGGYSTVAERYSNPLRRHLTGAARSLATLDRIYVGVCDKVDHMASILKVDMDYLPMAANCLKADARPFENRSDRPIAVTGFGRQHALTVNCIADRLNRSCSSEFFYNTNYMEQGRMLDSDRYRSMFWQILRKTRISLAFDHLSTHPTSAKLSYIGPRWFESLAAGTVLVGRAPNSDDRFRLLNWKDATIDLPENPYLAPDVIEELLRDEERLREVSKRNLKEMYGGHDWRHRLVTIYEREGFEVDSRMLCSLENLSRWSDKL